MTRTGRTALVTGASSGIGLELARLLAAGGYNLVLVARSTERLANVARELRERHGVDVQCHPRDLANPCAVARLWEQLAADGVAVDALVNSAGTGLHGPFSDQNVDAIDRLVTLNVGALTMLTRLALPYMLAQRSGRILNVASLVAYQPGGPQEAVYYASKSFVLSFSKSLAREVRRSGVTVTVLCPGPTKTSFEVTMRGSGVVIPGMMTKLLAFAGELPPRRVALEVNQLLLRPVSMRS